MIKSYFSAILNKPTERLNILIALPIFIVILWFIIEQLLFSFNWLLSGIEQGNISTQLYENIINWCQLSYWALLKFASNPNTYIGLPIIFLVQYLMPANPQHSATGKAMQLDLIYTFIMISFYALIAVNFKYFLSSGLLEFVPNLKIDYLSNLPISVQIVFGYLLIDFLGWFHHLVRHKIPFLWAFHAVHHSQTELNPFSNQRVHWFDWFSANVIKFLPALLFSEPLKIAFSYLFIHQALDHFSHSNTRTNMGWLKYLLVTPQSHRVHHTSVKAYFDKNFGITLSVWDHMFGTQCKNYQIYPDTGIPDNTFPLETNHNENLLTSLCKQQIYPFRKIYTLMKQYEDVSIAEKSSKPRSQSN